jgi:hypothetical protein
MKPRFLADADFNEKIILGLLRREPTIDFQTASQGDVIGRPDPEVLAIAARENRILICNLGRSPVQVANAGIGVQEVGQSSFSRVSCWS